VKRAATNLAGAGLLLAACAVTEPWPADRAWIDSGCEAAGELCPVSELALEARRLSLKADR